MASLSHLPTELVEYIVTYLSQHDKSSFCRLNRHLSTLATPFLYRHVDLFIPPGNKLPRIDRFCLNIIDDRRKANNVDSVRLGISPNEGTIEGQRWLPQDKLFNDQSMFNKAMDVLSNETLVAAGDYLRDAIGMYTSNSMLIVSSITYVPFVTWTHISGWYARFNIVANTSLVQACASTLLTQHLSS
jgi:hypothetical protein